MGNERFAPANGRVYSASHQLRNTALKTRPQQPASAASLINSSVSVESSITMSSLNFRKYSTLELPEMCQVRAVQSSRSLQLDSKSKTAHSSDLKTKLQPKRLTLAMSDQFSARNKKQALVNLNVPDARKTCRSFLANQTATSCYKHSNSTTQDSQKSSLESDSQETAFLATGGIQSDDKDDLTAELTEEEEQRRINIEKCLSWLANLPDKFSGMYILQERAPVILD